MKCPKCGYLGFDRVDRCRNCGYEFSLTAAADELELPLKMAVDDEPRQPLADLAFLDEAVASQSLHLSGSLGSASTQLGRVEVIQQSAALSPEVELPLFGAPIPDDAPLITKASPPRPPLAVRRATPEATRLRAVLPRTAPLDFETADRVIATSAPLDSRQQPVARMNAADEDAPVMARLAAVVTDLLILAAIDVAVVYLTLQICGIGMDDLGILPKAPLLAFLLVENGGYLVAFTAGGQTLGKMAAGIKVVSAEPRAPLDLGRAFIRELIWLILAAPAGLGLLTVLGRDRRGVHDRFAGTRVVRG